MNTEEFIDAIDEMDSDTLAQHFEALMALAMSVAGEGEDEDEENQS